MKKFMILLILFSIAVLGYSQNIAMVTYHPSKYGNYDVLDTSGYTILASETTSPDSVVVFSNLTSPYDVNVVQLDSKYNPNFLVGNASNRIDMDVEETVTLSGKLDVGGNLTVVADPGQGRNITIEDFEVRSGDGDVTGTLNVINDLTTFGSNNYINGNGTFSRLTGSHFVIEDLTLTSGGDRWTFPQTGVGIVMKKTDTLTWNTIEYYPGSSTTTAFLTLLVLTQEK